MRQRAFVILALTVTLGLGAVPLGAVAQSFVAFERGPVRPLAASPNGSRLLAVNTPANRLEVFDTVGGSLLQVASIPVGMEPVAVAARTESEVWVVNHLSDSVSIVDLSLTPPRVVRTLLVGDEPSDIVFAGTVQRAFITCAHRGQNGGFDPQLQTEGVPRADVWVFDAANPGNAMGGNAIGRVELFGDTPRALAVSPDGLSVYAAVFHSGNQTSAVIGGVVDFVVDSEPTISRMPPLDNVEGAPAPHVGAILKWDGSFWRDAMNQNWGPDALPLDLPDLDVFRINADDAPANMATNATSFASVGTILFNMVVGPTGKVYVSNTEAFNHVRFEGPGTHATASGVPQPSTLRGHLHESRITVIDGGTVTPRHLNPHIDYSQAPVAADVNERSLAFPLQMVLSGDGSTLYVAAFGSSKVGVFDTAEIDAGTFTPDAASHIEVSGGGPAGLVLDEASNRLYVWTRFDNSISVVDLAAKAEIGKVALLDPEPTSVSEGRPFLYDARLTSDRGDSACASCHVFGRMDDLAWNLGDPDGATKPNNNALNLSLDLLVQVGVLTQAEADALGQFHPMKGPMTTQTLRGMATHGPMHWRGDRTGADNDPNDFLDTDLAFKEFIVAFDGLLGGQPLTDPQMQAYTDFILQTTFPPNPIRNLDNTDTPDQAAGRQFWNLTATDAGATCNGCHGLEPTLGFFGATGITSFDGETQLFKIPHMQNMYQKLGMFGTTGGTADLGPQVRGFGYLHDGSVGDLFTFNQGAAFVFPGGDAQRRQVVDFMLAFPVPMAPIVGQQLTRHSGNAADGGTLARIALLKERAGLATPEADLVVTGVVAGEERKWLMTAPDSFQSDVATDPPLSEADLITLAGSDELTFLSVPPGSGTRIALDTDEDTVFDGDDNCRIFPNLSQADADADDQGDDCECGDESGDGLITSADEGAIADCLDGTVGSCTALCDGDHDGACNAGDITAVQLALLSSGDLRCQRSPF